MCCLKKLVKINKKFPISTRKTQTSLLIVSITTCWQTFNYITDIKQTWLFFLISKTSNLTELPIHWWSCLWSISLPKHAFKEKYFILLIFLLVSFSCLWWQFNMCAMELRCSPWVGISRTMLDVVGDTWSVQLISPPVITQCLFNSNRCVDEFSHN